MYSCFLFPEYINTLHAVFCLTDESSIDCSGGRLKERQSVRKTVGSAHSYSRWFLLVLHSESLTLHQNPLHSLITHSTAKMEREREMWLPVRKRSDLTLQRSSQRFISCIPERWLKSLVHIFLFTFDVISLGVGFISSNYSFICNSNIPSTSLASEITRFGQVYQVSTSKTLKKLSSK